MFPPNQDKQLSFQSSSSPYTQTTIQQDQFSITGQYPVHDSNLYPSHNTEISNRIAHTQQKTIDNRSKRILHRDIERQRRKEKATLYTTLRNLLPLEYVKGKRAVSDHIHETVRYIKDKEKKIEKLGLHRDEIKKLYNMNSDNENLNRLAPTQVRVRSSLIGIEVVIDSGFGKQVLHLSQALELLLEEGLNVVSCVSNKVNQRIIHIIQSEVSYMTCIDISELQTKLIQAIPSSNSENLK